MSLNPCCYMFEWWFSKHENTEDVDIIAFHVSHKQIWDWLCVQMSSNLFFLPLFILLPPTITFSFCLYASQNKVLLLLFWNNNKKINKVTQLFWVLGYITTLTVLSTSTTIAQIYSIQFSDITKKTFQFGDVSKNYQVCRKTGSQLAKTFVVRGLP